VNYSGKIVIQGNVSDVGPEAEAEGHERFGACYANPQPTFDPSNCKEPTRLKSGAPG
jgi:hypothetical protein